MSRPWTCLAVSLLLAVAPRLPAQEQPQPQPDYSIIAGIVESELKENHIPGAAIAIVRGDQVVYAQGFGVASVETETPVTPDSLFRLGSTTKMFTATVLRRLAGHGKLKLDAPIGQYVKDLPPFLAPLTVHQLLSHTAGITDEAPMHGRHDDDALGRGIRAWKEDFIFAPPGKVYSYSNPGYWLAGLVAEEVVGKPFADVVDDEVFRPLRMRSTTFRPTVAMTHPLAVGHGVSNERPFVIRPFADNAATWPAGSIFSSVNDLGRWATSVLYTSPPTPRRGSQYPPQIVALTDLAARHVALPGADRHYGYGLMSGELRGVPVAEHTGSRSGYGSLIRFLPEQKAAVIILTNRTGGQLPRTAELATALLAPLGPKPAISRPEHPLSAEEIAGLVGTYTNNRERVELFERDGKLFIRQGQREMSAAKTGPNRLKVSAGDYIVIAGEDGKPEYLHHGGRTVRRAAK
jgi:CubicO group peptidase (beta-lactamase class C family)